MANSLGTLTLDLIARVGGFTAPLTAAEVAAKKAADRIAAAADNAAGSWGSLGDVVKGAVAAFSIGAVFSQFIQNTIDAENEQAQLNAVLQATGNSAGYTAGQLNDMAAAMSVSSIFSGGDFSAAQTSLLAFTGVVGAEFPRALQAAADMATRTGSTVQAAAETIGRALDVPSVGLTSLSKQGFRFSEDQKKLALAFESVGDVASAQGIILDALEESYAGAALAARNTLGGSMVGLKNSLDDLLTQDGGIPAATSAVNMLSEALASPAARIGLDLTIKAAGALATILAVRLVASAVATAGGFALATVQAVQYQLALARMAGIAPTTAAGLLAVGGAARIAAAGMALVGGPAGLAVIAVGAAVAYLVSQFTDGADAAKELTTQVDYMSASFEGLTKNQAAAKLEGVTQALNDAQLKAIDASTAVQQYTRLLRDHPDDARVKEWSAALVAAQGELDTTSRDVDILQGKVRELYGVMATDVPVISASKVYTDLAAKLDEQILLSDKKTNADKLQARIAAGLVKGLKEGEGDLLVAKQRTLDATEAGIAAAKAAASASKSAATAAASADAAIRKRAVDAAEGYERQIALINGGGDATKAATEVSKLRFEIESGKLKDLNALEQAHLLNLAGELDAKIKLKKQNEEGLQLAVLAANLKYNNTIVRQGFEMELAGAGSGDKLKERLKEDLAIQQDYAKQRAEMYKQYKEAELLGDPGAQVRYDKETELLEEALAERVVIQQDHYNQLDQLQRDGTAGFISGFATQVEASMDLYGNMKAVGADTFSSLTSAMTEWAETGKLDAQGLAASFIQSVGHALLSYAAAQVAMAGLSAFASMIGIPFVGPVVAPGAAIAATAAAGVMMTAVGSALDGQAHDGIDYVPADGTWNLKKGERVTTAETSAKLDRTLDRVSRGGSPADIGLTVNLIENPSRAGQVERGRNSDGSESMTIFAAQIRAGGNEASDTFESVYGLKRSPG